MRNTRRKETSFHTKPCFDTTKNSESEDFFWVFLVQEFDVNLNDVDRQLIGKPMVANGYSLVFRLQTTLPYKSVIQTITFVVKCLISNF